MKRVMTENFLGGFRQLKRELGRGIIDKSTLYSPIQSSSENVKESVVAKLKERNHKYIEQKRKMEEKQEEGTVENIKIDSCKGKASPEYMNVPQRLNFRISRNSQTSSKSLLRAQLSSSNNRARSSNNSHKSLHLTINCSVETDESVIASSGKEKPSQVSDSERRRKLEHTPGNKRLATSSLSMRGTANNFRLLSSSVKHKSNDSMLFQSSENQAVRRNGLQYQTPFVRELKSTDSNLYKISMRKFITARRILKVINQNSEDVAISGQRNWDQYESSKTRSKQMVEDFYRSMAELINNVNESINVAIQVRKEKSLLDKCLTEILSCAQKSHNIELYISALKLHAKILAKYKDLYRAITHFKTIKRMCDQSIDFRSSNEASIRNYLYHKLSAYRNLGKCFQSIQNYKMAVFYFVKTLQTAWLLEDRRKELLAYDSIGLQYYYMGEVENANFYHEKMLNGNVERTNSDLRDLGVQKLKSNIQDRRENKHKTKFKGVKSVEEELISSSIPASEDEFELPDSKKQKLKSEEENRNDPAISIQTEEKTKFTSFTKVQNKFQKNISFRRQLEAAKTHSRSVSQNPIELKSIVEFFAETPKPIINISHLSPNRFLTNFHNSGTKDIVNAFLSTERLHGTDGRSMILDRASLESIRHSLNKFKTNLIIVKIEIEKIMTQQNYHTETLNNERKSVL